MNIKNTIIPTHVNTVNRNNNYQSSVKPVNTSNISFKGGTTKLIQTLDKSITDVINSNSFDIVTRVKFHKILNKALPEIMKPENFINKGRDSKVYKISDNYVAKVKRGVNENNAVRFYDVTTCPDKRFTALNFYYGEPIIKLGDVEILKNATPTSNFIHCGTKYKGMEAASSDEIAQYENNVLPVIASLPQESYDEFARGLRDLNKITTYSKFKKTSYIPDIINPNNLLIADDKIKLVDKLDKVPIEKPNSIYTMLEALLYRLSPETYAPKNSNLYKPRCDIFKKCLIAAEKSELPLESDVVSPHADYFINILTGKESASCLSELLSKRNNKVPLNKRLEYIEKSFN